MFYVFKTQPLAPPSYVWQSVSATPRTRPAWVLRHEPTFFCCSLVQSEPRWTRPEVLLLHKHRQKTTRSLPMKMFADFLGFYALPFCVFAWSSFNVGRIQMHATILFALFCVGWLSRKDIHVGAVPFLSGLRRLPRLQMYVLTLLISVSDYKAWSSLLLFQATTKATDVRRDTADFCFGLQSMKFLISVSGDYQGYRCAS